MDNAAAARGEEVDDDELAAAPPRMRSRPLCGPVTQAEEGQSTGQRR